jgi:hypothetical protein
MPESSAQMASRRVPVDLIVAILLHNLIIIVCSPFLSSTVDVC